MTDDDARAERAFRTALADRAEALHPVPLTTPVHRRSGSVIFGAAAAVLVVLAGVGLLALRTDGEPSPSNREPASEHLGDLPRPDDGWKWVSYMGVAVQVPEEWHYE